MIKRQALGVLAVLTALAWGAEPASSAPAASLDEDVTAQAWRYSGWGNRQVGEPAKEGAEPVYPFTGLAGAKTSSLPRPVVVMVENSRAARPQSGLHKADMVYEILAEGDITRFVAVYQSHSPAVIGPVRSIRPYFVEIGDGLDALIVHAGWSQDAMNLITERKLNHFDQVYGDSAYYWRSQERKAPHNLYTSIDKIRQGALKKNMRPDWKSTALTFASPHSEEGAMPVQTKQGQLEADSVHIPYLNGYRVGYVYDEASQTYSRLMNGEDHKDKESGQPLSAANIIICKARHKIVDQAGRREVDVFGPGTGYLVQKGQAREITWQRKNGVIRPFAGGVELELLPGQTWVQIVPEASAVTFGAR